MVGAHSLPQRSSSLISPIAQRATAKNTPAMKPRITSGIARPHTIESRTPGAAEKAAVAVRPGRSRRGPVEPARLEPSRVDRRGQSMQRRRRKRQDSRVVLKGECDPVKDREQEQCRHDGDAFDDVADHGTSTVSSEGLAVVASNANFDPNSGAIVTCWPSLAISSW